MFIIFHNLPFQTLIVEGAKMDSTSPQRVLSGKQDVPIKSASKHDKSEITVRSMERKPKTRNTEQVSLGDD